MHVSKVVRLFFEIFQKTKYHLFLLGDAALCMAARFGEDFWSCFSFEKKNYFKVRR
jgi:hypothetical protein